VSNQDYWWPCGVCDQVVSDFGPWCELYRGAGRPYRCRAMIQELVRRAERDGDPVVAEVLRQYAAGLGLRLGF